MQTVDLTTITVMFAKDVRRLQDVLLTCSYVSIPRIFRRIILYLWKV